MCLHVSRGGIITAFLDLCYPEHLVAVDLHQLVHSMYHLRKVFRLKYSELQKVVCCDNTTLLLPCQ